MFRQALTCGLVMASMFASIGCIGTTDTKASTPQQRAPANQAAASGPSTPANPAAPHPCRPPSIATGQLFATSDPTPCDDPPSITQEVVEQPPAINRHPF